MWKKIRSAFWHHDLPCMTSFPKKADEKLSNLKNSKDFTNLSSIFSILGQKQLIATQCNRFCLLNIKIDVSCRTGFLRRSILMGPWCQKADRIFFHINSVLYKKTMGFHVVVTTKKIRSAFFQKGQIFSKMAHFW